MRRDWFDTLYPIGMCIAVVLLIVGIVATLVRDCSDQRRCERAGGRVEQYNCSTILVPVSCGSGCTLMVPTQSCDWRCVGASPETPLDQ